MIRKALLSTSAFIALTTPALAQVNSGNGVIGGPGFIDFMGRKGPHPRILSSDLPPVPASVLPAPGGDLCGTYAATSVCKILGQTPAPLATSPIAPNLSYTAPFSGAVTQTQQSKNAERVSVRDFGAACNGTTDDSLALALAANTLANTGAEIFVPSNCRLRMGGATQVWFRGVRLSGPAVKEMGSQGYTYGQQGGTIIIDTPTLANGGVSPFLVSSDWSMTGLIFYWPGQTEYTAAAQPGTTATYGGAVPFAPLIATHGTDFNYLWTFSDNQVENAYDIINLTPAIDTGHFHWERNTEFAARVHIALSSMGAESWITNNQFSIIGSLYLNSGTNTAGPGGTQSPFYLRTYAGYNGVVLLATGNGSNVATTASAATTTNTVAVASAAGIAAGQYVSIAGGAATLTVVSVSGNNVTLSGSATIASGAALVFAAQSTQSLAGLRFANNYALAIRYGIKATGGNIGLSTFTDNGFDQVSTAFQADTGGVITAVTVTGGTWICQNVASGGGGTVGSIAPCLLVQNAAFGNRILMSNVQIGASIGPGFMFTDKGGGGVSPLLNISGGGLLNIGNVSVGNPYAAVTFNAPGGDLLINGTTITTTAAAQSAAQGVVVTKARSTALAGVTFGGWNVAEVVNATAGLHSLVGSHAYGTTAPPGSVAVAGPGAPLVSQAGNSWDVWNNAVNLPSAGLGASAGGFYSGVATTSSVDPAGNTHTTSQFNDPPGGYHTSVGGVDYVMTSTGFTLGAGPILPSYTVATLPACTAALKNQVVAVSDATSPTYNGTLTSGGAINTLAACNGTAWTAH